MRSSTNGAIRGVLSCAIAALLMLHAPSAAQQGAGRPPYPVAEETPVPETVALRGPIDENVYIVGPGDRLAITVWGTTVRTFDVAVSPEGELLVPGVAGVSVAGLTLARAKDLLEDRLSDAYRNVEFSIALLGLRRIQVNVLGGVKEPGVYDATVLQPASELIARAGGLTGEASRRNILVTRRDGATARVDLDLYENAGDVDANPSILDGDVIFVPAATTSIHAWGALALPGEYDFVEGDEVGSLIAVAGGFTRDAFGDTVELRRFVDATTTRSVMLSLLESGGSSRALLPGDQLYVRRRADWHEAEWVRVEGEVVHPGTFGINEGVDRVSDVLERTGGPTDRAYLGNARILRAATARERDLEFDRLIEIPVGSMSETEYAYYKTRLREQGQAVSVDFRKLLAGDESQDALLMHGDVITIPKMPHTVTVSGQVERPGKVAHEPGRRYGHYVDSAGGFSDGARRNRARVIRASTGQWLSARRAGVVEPGDEVWIPEKPESDWWKSVRDVLSFVTSLATVYLVIDQATSN